MLQRAGHKKLVRYLMWGLTEQLELSLLARVILDNHYPILIKSRLGVDLPSFIQRLHGRSSFHLNRRDGTRGRQIWHNYWDTCIRSQADYWTRFNHFHHHPVKPGYVEHSADWPFPSYRHHLDVKGEAWIDSVLRDHPITDFADPADRF